MFIFFLLLSKMAAMKSLLSQLGSRRFWCSSIGYTSLTFHRYLSSKPYPDPIKIQPVSYAPRKPTSQTEESPPPPTTTPSSPSQDSTHSPPPPPPPPTQDSQFRINEAWTREDIRYMKNAPSISITPVSYQARVAPLPEDTVNEYDDKKEEESEDIERQRRIQNENRRRRVHRVVEEEEEKVVLPFPRLIKPVKKEKKIIFELNDAIKHIKANARTTFDETVEAHVKLGIDKSRSDLIVRGSLSLPHGSKKVLKVAVFAEGADAEEARAAGADIVGGVELVNQIAKAGKIDFDHCLTTPQFFPRIAKLGKILNRQGLMPDLKQGTVVSNVSKAVENAKKNQMKFKMDKTAIVHVGLGKASFTEESLRENIGAFMNALLQAKPAGLKKTSKYAGYVTSFHLCSTMGHGFPVSIQSLSKAVDHYSKVHLK